MASSSQKQSQRQSPWAAYVPRYILDPKQPGQAPWRQSFDGAVLFADVSGFTAMSERLARQGREGAEELTAILNRYFTTMIAILDSHGGDVIKFGGDAMLITFPSKTREDSVARALGAACRMQWTMREEFAVIRSSQGEFPLRMSIGISAGPVEALALGDEDRAEFSVYGDTVSRVAHVETIAEATEICIDAQTRDAAGLKDEDIEPKEDIFRLTKDIVWAQALETVSAGQSPLKAEKQHKRALPYVMRDLRSRLDIDSVEKEFEGEHRRVTTLFLLFDGLNDCLKRDSDKAFEEFQSYFTCVYDIAKRYDGTLAKIDLYPHGYKIMLLWGTPTAHENDEERALMAASELMRIESPYETAIGVNTGFVFSGEVGAASRKEYTVMGDAVNLSARLMSQAKPGEIKFGEETCRLAGSEFEYDTLPKVKVKGKSEPVSVYRLTGRKLEESPTAGEASETVGRAGELARMRQCMAPMFQNRMPALVLEGSAGVGKSHLAREFSQWEAFARHRIHRIEIPSYAKTMPFYPWRIFLRHALGLPEKCRPEDLKTPVARTTAESDSALEVLGDVFNYSTPGTPLVKSMSPKERHSFLIQVLTGLLDDVVREEPELAFFEGFENIDPLSLELLNEYLKHLDESRRIPFRFVVTGRPGDSMVQLREQKNAFGVLVPSFDQGEVDALLCLKSGLKPHADLVDFIFKKAKGNPLFSWEMLRGLEQAGLVERDEQLGSLALKGRLDEAALPDTLHAIFLGRIDALDEPLRNTMKVLSVLGARMPQEIAASLLESEKLGERELKTLSEAMIIVHEAGEIHVVQPLMVEALYESLPYKRKRDLHRRAGEAYEAIYSDHLEPYESLLAEHFYEGRESEKALVYLNRTAEKAMQQFANFQALSSYERVLELLEKSGMDSEKAKIRLAMAAIHFGMGDMAASETDCQKVMEFKETSPSQLAEAVHGLGRVSRARGDLKKAQEHYNRSLEIATKDGHSILEAKNLSHLGILSAMQGQWDEAIERMDRAFAIFKEQGRELEQVVVAMDLATVDLSRGKLKEAKEGLSKMIARARGLQAVHLEARALINLGLIHWRLREEDDSIRVYQSALEILEKYHLYNFTAHAWSNIGLIHLEACRLEEAELALRKGLVYAERVGSAPQKIPLLANLVLVSWRKECRVDEAVAHFKETLRLLRDVKDPAASTTLRFDMVEMLMSLREMEHIKVRLDELNLLIAEHSLDHREPEYLGWLSWYLSETGRPEEGLKEALRAVAKARARDNQKDLTLGLFTKGMAEKALHKVDEAKKSLRKAAEAARQASDPMFRARALGLLALVDWENGESHARKALDAAMVFPCYDLHARLYITLGLALLKHEKPKEACAAFRLGLENALRVAANIADTKKQTTYLTAPIFTEARNQLAQLKEMV